MLVNIKMDREQLIRSFRFMNLWLKEETCLEVIKKNWTAEIKGNPFIMFHQKLKNVK